MIRLKKNTAQPAHKGPNFNDELMGQLLNRFSSGGPRFSRGRLYFIFMVKRTLWKVVTASAYFLKRLLDIAVSAVLLVLLFPLLLVTALAIKMEDSGPVFYRHTRVGKWGRSFTMYKFRSMRLGSDAMKGALADQNETGGVIFKIKNDPRITRSGKFIRKLSIDELPQLWNALRGDMSLVGPRPPIPDEVSQYKYSDRKRLDVIPGITCIWQVSGRSDINFQGQVKLDVQYIHNQSFWGDIKLLLQTIPAVLLGKGAY